MNRQLFAFITAMLVPAVLPAAEPGNIIVRGLVVYGMDFEEYMPVIADSLHRYITIQFDVEAPHPPDLKIRFLHCTRDWIPDESAFVQDEGFTTSFILSFRPSPGGVKHYAYRYINRFPNSSGAVRFTYSGNWIFRILDKAETAVLAEGRFFVVEPLVRPSARVRNVYQTNQVSPWNEVHRVDVHVVLPDEMEGMFMTTVDIYKNRRYFSPWRVDAWDNDPSTTVEGFGSGERMFSALYIPPGNEYRTLDFGNANRYPNRDTVRVVEGPDLPRPYWRTGRDHDGTAQLNRFTGIHSEYLPVMFRLKIPPADPVALGAAQVFVAGPFNDWNPGPEDMLSPDGREGALTVVKLLRRGVYDYQYVTGFTDESDGSVTGQDWLVLEGNDWRTINTYAAFVYYHDQRFGGFDRIAGYTVVRSTGEPGASQ